MRRRGSVRVQRRSVMAGALAAAFVAGTGEAAPADPAPPFDRETVRRIARERAAKPFVAADSKLPDEFAKAGYDEYRTIRFDPAQALWRGAGLPFEAQFFHRGWLYKDRVDMFEVFDGIAHPIVAPAEHVHHRRGPEAVGGGSGVRRVPPARADQPARLLRRGLRLPRRQLFPRRRQERGLRPLLARAVDQDRRLVGRGVPGIPRRSGSSARRRAPTASSSTPCSTARAAPPRCASPSGPATTP